MNTDKNVEMHASAEYMITNNNRVIKEGSVLAKYDGKNLDIMANKENKLILMQLTNKDIMDILAIPSSNLTLEERIMMDYPIKHKKRRYTRRHKSKAKKQSRKRTTTRRRTKKSQRKSKKNTPTITKYLGDLD